MTPFYDPATRTFYPLSPQVPLAFLTLPVLWAMVAAALAIGG